MGLVVGGGLTALIGGGLLFANLNNENDGSVGQYCSACSTKGWIFPTVLLGLGGGMLLAGVPLWVIGQQEQDKANRARAEVRMGPLSGSLRVTF
jgi:hypothetical protein